MLGTDLNLRVIKADIAPGNTKVKIQWSTHESGEFDATLLRAYAKTSALRTAGGDEHASDEIAWLRPFMGIPDGLAPTPESLNLWTGQSGIAFKEFLYKDVMVSFSIFFPNFLENFSKLTFFLFPEDATR